MNLPFHAAEQVLSDFRDQFIAYVDANTVALELLHKHVISRDVQERISKADKPEERSKILQNCLQRTCTNKSLMAVCDIIIAVSGNPRMRDLGKAMKRRLHVG